MAILLKVIERRARHVMVCVAVLSILVLMAFKAGLISRETQYNANAWYQQNSHGNFIVTKEFSDESACRQAQSPDANCRPGKALIDEARTTSAARGGK